MRKIIFCFLSLSLLLPVSVSATSKLGIGIFDYILSRTEFKEVNCGTYSCKYLSTDKSVSMELNRATLVQHINQDLNFLLSIDFDSALFKSGLLVQYFNDKDLIRVYIKGDSTTIKANKLDEITTLQNWLENALRHAKSS
ncbi:MAG: hypothetical protein H8E38_02950 [SAR324 cluster bacterium]|nr:hypothetical protein [SAR324 cluster bacterium]MBL7035152.1 hypothetical protein [SAR324 cluster bacterium]